MLLDGQSCEASTRQTFERISPREGAVVTRCAAAGTADAERAVHVAASAFPAWSEVPPERRAGILRRAGHCLLGRRELLVRAMSEETGADHAWASFNVQFAATLLEQAATLPALMQPETLSSSDPARDSIAIRRPLGVILSIAPWNAPVILGVRAIAAPLACGNTVVFKSSEFCPRTHRLVIEAMLEAGVPGGAINLIASAASDAGRIIESVISQQAVRQVNFTGSTRAGRVIAAMAARYLKPALLELGGKAPLLVLDDADLQAAAAAACFGAFANQGQICMSTERILVDEKVSTEFLDVLRQTVLGIAPADIGCLVNQQAAHRLSALIEDAMSKGASLVAGGHLSGLSLSPTVLADVTRSMRIYGEESFGPVVSVIRTSGDHEAIRIANDTEYGLAAAVFGKDTRRAMQVASQLESGICHINGPTVYDDPNAPFGGVKASGYGRFGGSGALHEFTELRWITSGEARSIHPVTGCAI